MLLWEEARAKQLSWHCRPTGQIQIGKTPWWIGNSTVEMFDELVDARKSRFQYIFTFEHLVKYTLNQRRMCEKVTTILMPDSASATSIGVWYYISNVRTSSVRRIFRCHRRECIVCPFIYKRGSVHNYFHPILLSFVYTK